MGKRKKSDWRRLVVLVTEDEEKRIKDMAGLVPVSRWIKVMLLGGPLNEKEIAQVNKVLDAEPGNGASDGKSEDRAAQDVPADGGVRVGGRRTARAASRKPRTSARDVHDDVRSVVSPAVRTCKHGTKRGYHCWQCGGIAQIGAA